MRWSLVCVLALVSCGGSRRGAEPRDAAPTDLASSRDLAGFTVGDDLAGPSDLATPFDPDAACIGADAVATVEYRPLDIVWVVDNSSSMATAIDEVRDGLNAFADLVAAGNLDYRIVLLSLRGHGTVQHGGTRYAVCVPPPLSGGTDCENGARFYHSSVDIKSVQPLEQVLGTLGQTAGYQPSDDRGGEAWKDFLRSGSSKTFVVVTDDNSRLSATQFESFAGGKNPYNTATLPPGILDASWNGLFTGYSFSGIYGWGSATDPSELCTFGNGTTPESPGQTYTTLVQKTGGVRAQICDGSSAWSVFFQQVATAVKQSAKLDCSVLLPAPPSGQQLDPGAVNVSLVPAAGSATQLFKVIDEAACGSAGGWYYDDDQSPQRVELCPTTCASAQTALGSTGGQVHVAFGCATFVL